jgi:hypothetical protein
MNLAYLISLNDGIAFHRFRSNPLRPGQAHRLPYLVPVKPVPGPTVQPTFTSGAIEPRPRRLAGWAERVEAVILRFMLGLLVVASIGCGFGVQHIAYVRDKNAVCQQLRRREIELQNVTLAYRSLECSVARQATQEAAPAESLRVMAQRPTPPATISQLAKRPSPRPIARSRDGRI